MAYVTLDEFKAFAKITGTDDDYPTLCIEAAAEFTDRYCGRSFAVPTATTTRYYRVYSDLRRVMAFDDLATTDSLVVHADQSVDGSYGQLLTLDSDFFLPQPQVPTDPFTELHSSYRYWFPRDTYSDRATVKVVGKFGWPAVPQAVKHANLLYANRLYQRSKGPTPVGGGSWPGGGGEIVTPWSDPDVTMLLQKYQRFSNRVGLG